MTKLRSLFTDHPATVGETYSQHLICAAGFSVQMMIGAICCLAHAIFPFLCQTTGSGKIERLYSTMVTNRQRVGRVDFDHETNPQSEQPQTASHSLT